MIPGDRLDAKVAERVFGMIFRKKNGVPKFDGEVPCYSTDIADAWTVVEKLRSKGLMWRGGYFAESGGCDVAFGFALPSSKEVTYSAQAPAGEVPFAICLAALKAVGHV